MLGQKFDEALALASELHREQIRKDAPIPYISHLMAVAGIVLEANAYHPMDNLEDVAVGALLHDVIEDQGHKIDLDQIKERFGETVQRIVSECSDATPAATQPSSCSPGLSPGWRTIPTVTTT